MGKERKFLTQDVFESLPSRESPFSVCLNSTLVNLFKFQNEATDALRVLLIKFTSSQQAVKHLPGCEDSLSIFPSEVSFGFSQSLRGILFIVVLSNGNLGVTSNPKLQFTKNHLISNAIKRCC